MLIIATSDGCRSWKVPEDLGKPEKFKSVSSDKVNVCVVGDTPIACVSVFPSDTGRHHIDVMEMENEEWHSTRTIRVKLPLRYVYDVCVTNSIEGPLLVMCSWQQESVTAVGLHDGKVKWTNNTEKAGMKIQTASVCADDSDRLFVAIYDRHSIYELSPEDGSIISRLELNPPVMGPVCIRFHQGKLYVAHMDADVYKATNEKKWNIGLYTIG